MPQAEKKAKLREKEKERKKRAAERKAKQSEESHAAAEAEVSAAAALAAAEAARYSQPRNPACSMARGTQLTELVHPEDLVGLHQEHEVSRAGVSVTGCHAQALPRDAARLH